MTAGFTTGIQTLSTDAPSRFDLGVGCGGIVLGIDRDGEPVSIQLFRARPTQLVLLTAGYVARLLALRALAVGSAVHVATSRPDDWQAVAVAAPPGRALLVQPGSALPAEMSPSAPVLRCDDTGPGGAAVRTDVGAWQARAVVQDFTPAQAVSALRAYDLVILQRTRPDLVHPLQTTFDLPQVFAEALPQMPDDVVAVVTPDRSVLLRLIPTPFEESLLGAPVRHEG